MGQQHFLEDADWSLGSRRRRIQVADFMVGVAIAAIGLAAISMPDLTGGERLLSAVVVLAMLALQWIQWGLASVRAHRPQCGTAVLLGFTSSLLALTMFVALVILGLFVPQGAALLSVMILIQVVHLTTWD